MKISDSILLQLYDYKVEFLLWDNKEKMMARTKFDKTRGAKCDVDENEMKKSIEKQHEQLLQLEKRNPQNVSYIFEPIDVVQRISEDKTVDESPGDTPDPSLTQLSENISKYITPEKKKQKVKKKETFNQKIQTIAKIVFKMCHFFSDTLCIIKHLSNTPVGLIDMVVSINLSENLLSAEQKQVFNPMVICIHSVNDMPGKDSSEGVTYEQLKEKCQPVYVKYEFMKYPPYRTPAKSQQKSIYFNDVNVILTGMLDKTELKQYLQGPSLLIEVHDRDRYGVPKEKRNSLFGTERNDDKFSNISYIKNKKGQPSAKISNIYGICKLNLFELMQGKKYIYRELPILHHRSEIFSSDNTIDSNDSLSLLSTPKYIECNSVLKLTIKLSHAFFDKIETSPKRSPVPHNVCLFSRVIFKIDEKCKEYVHNVLLTVAKLNAKQLGFDNLVEHVMVSVLSTYILSSQQLADRTLDIITGFHFVDQNLHLIVIEGLQTKALAQMIKIFNHVEVEGFAMLYNTEFVCSERLYLSLNTNILKIKLSLSLSKILKQPLLYVRNVVPRPCFDCVIRLFNLIGCNRLMDAVYYKCFPDADMIRSLTSVFVSFTPEDIKTEAITNLADKEDIKVDTKEDAKPIPMESCPQRKKEERHKTVNFIKHNAKLVHLQSEENRMKAVPQKMVEIKQPLAEMQNYSICTFNSIELAKRELVNTLDKNTLYTYGPEFHHTMTIPPVKDTLVKSEKPLKKNRRWILAQQKSILQRHVPIQRPSEARLEEIYQPYEDLSCYPERDKSKCERNYQYSWKDRKYDFDLWKNSLTKLNESAHVTESTTSDELHQKEIKEKEIESWKAKIVVSNTREKFHRVLPNTELLEKGPEASCQLERLKGLLKDEPEKLAYAIYPLHQMSALGVVNYPELDCEFNASNENPSYSTYHPQYERNNAFVPGPLWPKHSLIKYGNQTPLSNYAHDKHLKQKGKRFMTMERINPPFSTSRPVTTTLDTKEQKRENKTLKKSNTLPPQTTI
ncbi:uncharacterized protein LOC115217500 isoform X3 [Octopus sinensis]|nr:uncharacterized protein LOC115217500 isoform X3 [Octopus sinensis]